MEVTGAQTRLTAPLRTIATRPLVSTYKGVTNISTLTSRVSSTTTSTPSTREPTRNRIPVSSRVERSKVTIPQLGSRSTREKVSATQVSTRQPSERVTLPSLPKRGTRVERNRLVTSERKESVPILLSPLHQRNSSEPAKVSGVARRELSGIPRSVYNRGEYQPTPHRIPDSIMTERDVR